jgi:hypothetical protein
MLTANETIAALAARFPRAFFVYERRRRPLKIGIHLDLAVAAPDIPAKAFEPSLSHLHPQRRLFVFVPSWCTAHRSQRRACRMCHRR